MVGRGGREGGGAKGLKGSGRGIREGKGEVGRGVHDVDWWIVVAS